MERKRATKDKLFIQEIMNDLHKRGQDHGKAWELLRDWSAELRAESGLTGKTKKTYYKEVGRALW